MPPRSERTPLVLGMSDILSPNLKLTLHFSLISRPAEFVPHAWTTLIKTWFHTLLDALIAWLPLHRMYATYAKITTAETTLSGKVVVGSVSNVYGKRLTRIPCVWNAPRRCLVVMLRTAILVSLTLLRTSAIFARSTHAMDFVDCFGMVAPFAMSAWRTLLHLLMIYRLLAPEIHLARMHCPIAMLRTVTFACILLHRMFVLFVE